MSSMHHSFDVHLASIYGIKEAIIIHHFQHWISINKRLKRNFHEGRTWSYQTLDEIAAHFPYFSKSEVFEILNRLCNGKNRKSKKEKLFDPVLKKGNFNKSKFDKTVWYSFENEKMFTVLVNTNIGGGKYQYHDRYLPTPIPDTKPDTETKEKTSKETKDAFANASSLSRFFYDEMKKRNPVVPIPRTWASWNLPLKELLKGGASEEQIKKMIVWCLDHEEFWKSKITKPQNIYNSFNTIEKQMLEPEKLSDSSFADEVIKQYSSEILKIEKNDKYIEFQDKRLKNPSKIIEYGKDFRRRVNDFLQKCVGKSCG